MIRKILLTRAISEKNKVAISPLNTNPGPFSFVTEGKWDSGHRQSSLESETFTITDFVDNYIWNKIADYSIIYTL